MAMAARAAAVVLGATAIVLATRLYSVVDDARVVAAPDMGKAAATASDCTSVDAPMTSDPRPRRRRAGHEDPAARRLGAGDDDGLGADPVHDAQHRLWPRTASRRLRSSRSKAIRVSPSPKRCSTPSTTALESGVGATDVHVTPKPRSASCRPRPSTTSTPPIGPIRAASGEGAVRGAADRRQDVRDDADGADRRPRQPDISARCRDDPDRLPDAPAVGLVGANHETPSRSRKA